MRTFQKKVIILMLAAAATITAAAQIRPFVQIGVGCSEFWLYNSGGTTDRFAYLGGAGIEFPIKNTPLGIQASLILTSKGANAPSTEYDDIETNISLIYLEMPLDVTYHADIGGDWKVKVAGGPYFAYGIGGDTEVKTPYSHSTNGSFSGSSPMRRFDAGLNIQVLFEYKWLFMGLNWDNGFVPIHKRERKLDNKIFPANSSIAVTVGMYIQ